MWIKTEEDEIDPMTTSQWPRAIAVVEDERTGSTSYHFTYTPPTRPLHQPIAVKRNSSNGSSYAASISVLQPDGTQGDNREGKQAAKRRRGGRKHCAARQSKSGAPFSKQPSPLDQNLVKDPDHWCPCSDPCGGRYGIQYHSARCCKSQARLFRPSCASVYKRHRPPPASASTRTSQTQRRQALKLNTRHGKNIQPQQRFAPGLLANTEVVTGERRLLRIAVNDKGRQQSMGPPLMLEIHGLAAKSIARSFWCPKDRTLQVHLVALLKRWCRMLMTSLETGEQQFDNSELRLRQSWGLTFSTPLSLDRDSREAWSVRSKPGWRASRIVKISASQSIDVELKDMP